MKKFQKASKRIAAVAVSAALISATATAAGLSTYPTNFVKNGAFTGDIVIGSTAAVSDSTAAASVISDLKKEFSGNSQKVKITYQSASVGGQTLNLKEASKSLNFGETLSDARGIRFTTTDSNVLADGTFNNAADSQDYNQYITIDKKNGYFEHSLNTNIGEDTATDKITLKNRAPIFTYELKFPTQVDFSSMNGTQASINDAFLGKKISLLGKDFVIGAMPVSGGKVTSMDLLGGANSVQLSSGESMSVSIGGVNYDVKVIMVDQFKALIDINGDSQNVNLYDSLKIGGINVAVTSIYAPNTQNTGLVTIVVGGNKITLPANGEVKVNRKLVSTEFPDYFIKSNITSASSKLSSIKISFGSNKETALIAGESYSEPVFNVFSLKFDGLNVKDSDYTSTKLLANTNTVNLEATTVDKKTISMPLVIGNGFTGANATDNIFHLVGQDSSLNGNDYLYTNTTVSGLDFSNNGNNIIGTRFLVGDINTQYLWEITSFDQSLNRTTFKNVLTGASVGPLDSNAWTDLDGGISAKFLVNSLVDVNLTSNPNGKLALGNQQFIDLSQINGSTNRSVYFSLDKNDITLDNAGTQGNESINVTFIDDTTGNYKRSGVVLNTISTGISTNLPSGVGSVDFDRNSNYQEFVTDYGTKVKYDNRNSQSVEFMVPNKQVEANVNLVIGGNAATTSTVTVDATEVDAKKQELIDAGNVIVGTPETMTATATKFDITAPVLDKDVTGTSDMIVVGGPAVNTVAAELLSLSGLTTDATKYGVSENEAVIRFFNTVNSVLVYGYSAENTVAAVSKLNKGGLTGDSVNVAN